MRPRLAKRFRSAKAPPWFERDRWRTVLTGLFLACLFALLVIGSRTPTSLQVPPPRSDADLRKGSIIIMPADGELCRQKLFDNDTGHLRDNGTIPCDHTMGMGFVPQNAPHSAATRINAIGDTFRRKP